MLATANTQRADHIRALAERLGPEVLVVDDVRDGWPALGRVKVGDRWVQVALHLGPIGFTHRGRDDVERRFQNPAQNKPLTDPPGYLPVLIGVAYDEDGEIYALVGLDAAKRIGRATRFSLPVPYNGLAQAARSGWHEQRSSSGELIRIAHPALLPVLIVLADVDTPIASIEPSVARVGQLSKKDPAQEAEARRCALEAASTVVFEREVRRAYDGQCAFCDSTQPATRVALLDGRLAGGDPELSDALPMCSPHFEAFRNHQIYVDPARRGIRIGPEALTSCATQAGRETVLRSTKEKLGTPTDGHDAVGAEQLMRHYRRHGEAYTWAQKEQKLEEPVPLVRKSEPAPERATRVAARTPSEPANGRVANSDQQPPAEQVQETATQVLSSRHSDDAIGSIEGLAELLLTSQDAKRSLILRNRIMGAGENSSARDLVGALLRRHGNELTVRKLLDSQPAQVVVDLLSEITWIGEHEAYRFVTPEDDPAGRREAVVCLTRLLLAHLGTGKVGVDSVAESSELLQPVSSPRLVEPTHAATTESKQEERDREEPEDEAKTDQEPPPGTSILEAVAMSSSGEVLVEIGTDILSLPSKAAKLIEVQWKGWSAIAEYPDFDLRTAVALIPGLNVDHVDAVVSHLQNGDRFRYIQLGEGPSIKEAALYLSSLPIEEGTAASERIRAVFFEKKFATQEEFLLTCLAAVGNE